MRLCGLLLMVVKEPPSRTLPSGCSARPKTAPFAPVPGSKVASSEPLTFRRAIDFRAVLLMVLNMPPSRILPSACNARARTIASAPVPGSKVVSSEPLVSSRAIRLRPVPLIVVNWPPSSTLPSG